MTVAPLFQNRAPELPYVTDRRHEPMLITITPELAARWLERVPEEQRSMRDNAVDRFAQDMRTSNWRIDYSPYHFSKEGELINGQHRLQAIIESHVTLEDQVVVFGMDRDDYELLDQGSKRTFADTLRWHRFANPNVVSSLVHKYYYWTMNGTFMKANEAPTQRELLQIANNYQEEMYASIKAGQMVANRVKPFTNTVVATAHLLCHRIEPNDADAFFGRLADGEELSRGNAIHTLRNRWAVNAAKQREKPNANAQAAHLLKAWNYWRDGRTVQVLLWKSGGDKPEAFPQPR